MNNHPFASTPQPSVGSNYPVLETVSSPISPYPNTSCTLQQLAGGSTPPPQKTVCVNTFVHKLYNMVIDNQYQHLIAWNYLGSSFIVCNIMEFSKDVLPKHFKHNNFSSFVRQLNMYGFHKVNKSPRGHRTLAENQIWEFSHSKFLRNRSDLLDDIKRKTMESDPARREGSDLQAHVAMIQMSQSDMMQQVGHLFENFHQVSKELVDIKKKYTQQQTMFRHMMQYIIQQNGGHVPPELCSELLRYQEQLPPPPPSIFVSSHDSQTSAMQDLYASRLVPSQFIHPTDFNAPAGTPSHPPKSLPAHGQILPPSPSLSFMLSDDETSLYSPHSPHTPQFLSHTTDSPHSMQHQNKTTFVFVNDFFSH